MCGPAIVSNWLHRRRGLGLSIVISSSTLIAIVWSQLSVALLGAFGTWRDVARVEGGIAILAPLCALLFVREKPEDLGQETDGGATDRQLVDVEPIRRRMAYKVTRSWTGAQALAHPAFWLVALSATFEIFVFSGLSAHQVKIFEASGLSVTAAVTIFGLVNTVSGFSRLIGGWISDLVEARYLMALFQLVLGFGLVVFALLYMWSGALYVYLIAVGLANGEIYLMTAVIFTNYFGTKAYPVLGGVSTPLQSLFGGAAPVVVGAMLDRLGSFVPVLIALALVNTAAAIMALLARPPHTHTAPALQPAMQ